MSRTFLNVYNRSNMQKTAVLENAWQITETKELNQIYHLEFSIPGNDPKAKYLQPFHFVRYGEGGQLYRIIKLKNTETDASTIKVGCEHVITTLCDTMIFGAVTYGGRGVKTANTINYLLGKQNTALWELGGCAFTRYFEYGWEQENLLNALYSIPKEFTAAYYWDFDTSGNPYTGQKWKIYLRAIDETINPEYYIRAKQNLLQQGTDQDNTQVCTKLYPLGYGEGVNQLGIKGTRIGSDGSPTQDGTGTPYKYDYLLAPKATRDKYGIIEKVLVDRRFENQASLYSYAQTILSELSTPAYSRSFSVSDLYPLTNNKIDDAEVGKICRMTVDGTTAYITKTVRVLDDPGNLQIDLSTSATDVVSSIADLADRVRIESVYAQGATQLYQHSKDANAAPEDGKGMKINLYFPSEMKQINKVLLKIELKPFRSYSSTTDTQETKVATTTTASKQTPTTSAGGGSKQTSSAGGGSATTGAASGSSSVNINGTTGTVWDQGGESLTISNTGNNIGGITMSNDDTSWSSGTTSSVDGSSGNHFHTFAYGTPSHTHGFTIPGFTMYVSKSQLAHGHGINLNGVGSHSHSVSFSSHTHSVTIPSHTHKITIPGHNHNVTIPGHTHKIIPGIFESSERAESFAIYVQGKLKGTINKTSYDGDITKWLLNDSNMISRNSWIDIEIRPNKLAYVVSTVFVQGFVQSRGGGNY